MRYLFLLLTFAFTTELEVDGNLKVTGTVDANGNAITNVGEPVLTSDVATANYVNTRTAGKGRIITLKCPWFNHSSYGDLQEDSCSPPECPFGWEELITFNEVVSTSMSSSSYAVVIGNSIRYCIEQEDLE